ncbi:MAG: hypothetical protein ACF8QF_14435 [Phycisphaerales bacterium]
MRIAWVGLFALAVGGALAMAPSGDAPSRRLRLALEKPPAPVPSRLCTYPLGRPGHGEPDGLRLLSIAEVESNDYIGLEQPLPLSPEEPAINVAGWIANGVDVDLFRVTLAEGDLLDAQMAPGTLVDSILAVFDASGALIVANDDDSPPGGGSQSATYPINSPLLRTNEYNPKLTFVAPASGDYILLAQGYDEYEAGPYTMQLRLRRGGFETLLPGQKQIIFVDFDGAIINAQALFGFGNQQAGLSPLEGFFAYWGLPNTQATRNAVIDAILGKIEDGLEDLRSVAPRLQYELRNSRDHADPFGQPRVTRLIIGGFEGQLGIPTIGIAESVDPGNYVREETAVVLLEALATNGSGIAAQNVARAAGTSLIDVIGRGVGNVAVHELGHLLGAWHTVNVNYTPCVMDAGGGYLLLNVYETGLDAVAGTIDDEPSRFVTDYYDEYEGVAFAGSIEHTKVRAAYALTAPIACPADFNEDDVVDGADLGALLGAWGGAGIEDLNSDGVIDGADLGLLLGAWGGC